MVRDRVRRFLHQYHITRHMMKVYTSSFTIMFSVGFTITMVFPYLPFMVKFLLPDVEDRNIGRYAGFLASSMYFGRFCGSYFWGWLADRHSKKTILMYSGVCMAFSSLFFGFSVNFYMAIFFRYLTGLTNGIVGNTKAMLCEHSDNVNQGIGMSMVTCAWGASIVFGPAVSGVIADPIGQYNIPSNTFLEKFPYCLPSMFSALLSVIGVVTVGCVLPSKPEEKHDNVDKRSDHDGGSTTTDFDVEKSDMNSDVVSVVKEDVSINLECSHDLETGSYDHKHVVNGYSMDISSVKPKLPVNGLSYKELLAKENVEEEDILVMDDFPNDVLVGIGQRKGSLTLKEKFILAKNQAASTYLVFISLLKDKMVFGTVLMYSLFSFATIGFDECFSLWAATSKSLGGLDFSLHNIGTALGIVGIILIPLSFVVYNPTEKRFGAQMTHHIYVVTLIILLPVFPSLTYLSGSPAALWAFLIIVLLIIRVAISCCFVSQALFINNSVTADKLGAVNGLALSMTSLFRTFSPVVFGIVYSLSLSDTAQKIGFPVNFHLVFLLFSLVYLMTMILTAFFPKRLNKQRK